MRRSNHEAAGARQRRHQRRILRRHRRRHRAVRTEGERRPQIVLALVVLRQVAAEPGGLARPLELGASRTACGSAAPGTARCRHRTTPDCRARRAPAGGRGGRASSAGRGAAPRARTRGRGPRPSAPSAPDRARRPRRRRSSPGCRRPSRARVAHGATMSSSRSRAMPKSRASAPSPRAERGEREAVGIDDLAGLRLGAGHDQFVAGADDGHLRTAIDLDLRIIHRGGEHQIAVVEAAAALEQHLAFD